MVLLLRDIESVAHRIVAPSFFGTNSFAAAHGYSHCSMITFSQELSTIFFIVPSHLESADGL